MTTATKPDKAINLEPKIKATIDGLNVTIDGLTLFSQEFIRLHTELIDPKRWGDPDFYELVLDPKDLLISNLKSIGNINKEFNETVTNIINSQMNKNQTTNYLKDLINFGLTLNGYYYWDDIDNKKIDFLGNDILDNTVLYSDMEIPTFKPKRINDDDLKKIFLLRYYKAKLEDLRKFILDHYDLIKFFKSGKTETHKQLFIGQQYICTVPSDKQKEAKELISGFLVKGVNTELLKDYLKVYLEIL